MRPCHGSHPVPVPELCPRCWQYVNVKFYRNLWDQPEGVIVTTAPPAPVGPWPAGPAPCQHRGELIPLAQRHELGVGTLRDWYPCQHPEKPLGDVVCGCRGCGPGCRGYVPAPAEVADVVEGS
jgi:hypothetical protein